MSLFENLSKKVSETAKAAAKKSSEMVEVTKLSMNISTEEGRIAKEYTEIGKAVYDSFAKGEEIPDVFREHCEKIKEYEESIQQMRVKIQELKNVKNCPSCGEELDNEVAFCPKCGAKQEIRKPVVEEPVQAAASAEKFCPACGGANPPEAVFCGKCGAKMG